MMRILTARIRTLVVSAALLLVPALVVPAPAVLAAADSQGTVCDTLNDISGSGCSTGGSKVNGLIRITINMLSVIAGVIAVIMVIVAGLQFVTSDGDAQKLANARRALIYAIIGMAVVALSQAIVKWFLSGTA